MQIHQDRVPRVKVSRTAPIDRATYGGTPAAVFLADMLNAAIELKEPNIGSILRKYGKLHEGLNATLNDLGYAFECDVLAARSVNHLVALMWQHVKDSMALLATETRHLDPRIPNLMRNVLAGSYKSFTRRLRIFNMAKVRQRSIISRLAKNKLDLDKDLMDPDTGIPLFEDGMLTRLSFKDFYEDIDEIHDGLWAKAKSVTKPRTLA